MMSDKGWKKQQFEAGMKLMPDQLAVDRHGHYTVPRTAELWRAFKLGLKYTPSKGSYVVAVLQEGQPRFAPEPEVHAFKNTAREAQRIEAIRSGHICVVYQQISAYNPVE